MMFELATYHVSTGIAIGLVSVILVMTILALIGSGPWGPHR